MDYIKLNYSEFISYKNQTGSNIHFIEYPDLYALYLVNGSFKARCDLKRTDIPNPDELDFEANYKNSSNLSEKTISEPFTSKVLKSGKKLFQRVYGTSESLTGGSNTFDFEIPYTQVKFNEIEIIGAELGDNCNLKILDNAAGTTSTIPNFELNQFGFNVNIRPSYYKRSSNYDADLISGMKIKVEYNSQSAKTIYINYILHEVKD